MRFTPFKFLPFFLIFVELGCYPFRDSPFSDTLIRPERNLNILNQSRVGPIENDGLIRIALLADSHQNYKDLDNVIGEINKVKDVDFVVNLGDFTNSGYNVEYDQFLEKNSKLKYPTLTVIGNHDALGAGRALFKKAFGPADFYFESEHIRFVFWNSANLEDEINFDVGWLRKSVAESSKPVIIFSHISLDDVERFEMHEQVQLMNLLKDPKVFSSIYGHYHNHDFRSNAEGTLLVQCPRVEGNNWSLFEIDLEGFKVFRKGIGGSQSAKFKSSTFF
ncbi:MAG: metallophosphoesterase [Bdellovibrionales bacterium]